MVGIKRPRPVWTGGAPGHWLSTRTKGSLRFQTIDQTEFEGLQARGVTFEEPEPADYGFGVRITAFDPDGNRISLRQPRKRNT